MVFRRLLKRGRDRARSLEWRRLGKAFQKDGPSTAKLLRWAVASLTLGTTRLPCSAERRDLRPGKDDTGTQSSLIHSFITEIYIAPLQGYYSEALPTLARLKRRVLRVE